MKLIYMLGSVLTSIFAGAVLEKYTTSLLWSIVIGVAWVSLSVVLWVGLPYWYSERKREKTKRHENTSKSMLVAHNSFTLTHLLSDITKNVALISYYCFSI